MKRNNYSYHYRSTRVLILILVFCIAFIQTTFAANRIIFPWRAASQIVMQGEDFEILLDLDHNGKIDSVIINGPYSKAKCEIKSVKNGTFVFDRFTKEAANLRLMVTVPAGTPDDMYDIYVYQGVEMVFSMRSLKVVDRFKGRYTVVHITDPHISRNWVGTAANGYAGELSLMDKLVEVINIIGPDLVICTGDLIHDYTRFNPDPDGWGGTQVRGLNEKPYIKEKWNNYFEGAKGLKGLQAINAPTFSCPGNHDFYGIEGNMYRSKQWNENCGYRTHAFSYGSTRYIMADDYLGDQDEYRNLFIPYLLTSGQGDLRVVCHHDRKKRDLGFFNSHSINLELYGHQHDPNVDTIGETPTISMRSGSATRTDWRQNGERTGWYRLIWIDNGKVSWSPALQFSVDPSRPHAEIEKMLTLDYLSPAEVSLENKYNIDLPAATVRFVLPIGKYKPDVGRIEQSFDNDTATIIDLRVDLPAQSIIKTKLSQVQKL